jgi:hypothetical protein
LGRAAVASPPAGFRSPVGGTKVALGPAGASFGSALPAGIATAGPVKYGSLASALLGAGPLPQLLGKPPAELRQLAHGGGLLEKRPLKCFIFSVRDLVPIVCAERAISGYAGGHSGGHRPIAVNIG